MGIINNLRYLLWPFPEQPTNRSSEIFKAENLTVEENDLDTCYDLALRYYDSEEERRKTIESKSTIFIGTIGFVIAILLNMATSLLLNSKVQLGFLTCFSIFMWVVIIIYFCRAVWFSISVLERRQYHAIGDDDFVMGRKDYKKTLITEIINKTRKNSHVINLKVDNMVLAQEYFKRGIVAVVVYSLVAGILGIYGLISKVNWIPSIFLNKGLSVFSAYWFPFLNAACLLINIAILVIIKKSKERDISRGTEAAE